MQFTNTWNRPHPTLHTCALRSIRSIPVKRNNLIIDVLSLSLKKVNFNGNMSIVFEDRGNQCDYAEAIGLAVKHLRGLLAEAEE